MAPWQIDIKGGFGLLSGGEAKLRPGSTLGLFEGTFGSP